MSPDFRSLEVGISDVMFSALDEFVSLIIYMGKGTKDDVTQDDSQRQFLVQDGVVILLQHCFE